MKILADQDIPFIQEYFGGYGELILRPGRLIAPEDAKEADLLLVRSITRVDERLLRQSAVKFVGTVSSGEDHLDTAWLDQAGILWRSAAGYNAMAVADYVIAVIAALSGQVPALRENPIPKVGVVGVGQVGGRVAERLQHLGFNVLLCDPPREQQEKDFISTPLSAFRDLDLVTVHTPLTQTGPYPTQHLLNAEFFSETPQKKLLINTSRGAVVDTSALQASLQSWDYCFDVWENEPQLDGAVLQAALLATPHLAGHSVQTRYRGIERIYHAACETGLIHPEVLSVPTIPRQTLNFEGRQRSWQEVVLTIWDPRTVSCELKTTLLKDPSKCATLFDRMRQQAIGSAIKRHELAYTTLSQVQLAERDREVLAYLGINFREE